MTVLVLVVVLAIFGFLAVGIYNRLVGLRVRAESAWADIDVQLKRRHDLVGNLVETVKGYATHEQSTLEKVVQARNQAVAAGGDDPEKAAAAESFLSSQLRQVFALAEAYPDLKANQNFLDLQASLGQLEDAIQTARRYYNAVVRDLNTRIHSFPDLILAGILGFRDKKFFELSSPDEAKVPEVKF